MDGKISAERLRSLFFVGKSLGLEWSLERTAEAPPQRGSSIFCHPGWLSGLNLPPSSQCPAFERRYWDSVNRLKGEVWSNSIIHCMPSSMLFFPGWQQALPTSDDCLVAMIHIDVALIGDIRQQQIQRCVLCVCKVVYIHVCIYLSHWGSIQIPQEIWLSCVVYLHPGTAAAEITWS